jgi:hypothetical protein
LAELCRCQSLTGFLPNVSHVFRRLDVDSQRTYLYCFCGFAEPAAKAVSTDPKETASAGVSGNGLVFSSLTAATDTAATESTVAMTKM